MADAEIDSRENEVAALARRAARAASARAAPSGSAALTIDDIDESMMATLGRAFGRIEGSSADFGGAMLFRGAQALPLVSLLPPDRSDEVRTVLLRIATGTRAQIDSFVGSAIGAYTDSIIATGQGAVVARLIGDDLLLVAVDGRHGDVGALWAATAAEIDTISSAAAELVKIDLD